MNLSPALPQTFTKEKLAQWITDNAKDTINHEEKVELTPEAISELEHKSSLMSRAIDDLTDVKKEFMDFLTNGTPIDPLQVVKDDEEPKHSPQSVTIQPTKGLKILTARRLSADQQLRDGYKTDVTKVYLIPFPEEHRMIAVDVEGNEYEQYSRSYTEVEEEKYTLPVVEEAKKSTRKAPRRADELEL